MSDIVHEAVYRYRSQDRLDGVYKKYIVLRNDLGTGLKLRFHCSRSNAGSEPDPNPESESAKRISEEKWNSARAQTRCQERASALTKDNHCSGTRTYVGI